MTPTPDTIAPAARADLLERIARAAEYRSTGARAARPTTKPEPPPEGADPGGGDRAVAPGVEEREGSMTAEAKPIEGVVRFRTPNPWDDPLFRSAIRGDDRARRRAEMQASIDKIEARRVGGQYREEATAEPAPVPVTTDATDTRSERWACSGCAWSSDKGSAISTHKKSCAGLYERRKAGTSTSTPPKPGPAYTCPECGLGATSQASLRGHRLAEHKEAVAAAVAKVDALLDDPKTVVVADFNDEPEPEAGPVPVAPEHVQADTPVEAPACPIGEPAAPTVAAEEGEKGMAKVETRRSAPKREPVGPARRPCGCGLTGRHLKTCALAPKEEPGVHVCPDCGKDCLSRSGLGGHMAWCEKRKERLAKEAAPTPSPYRPGSVADRAEKGDPEAIAELARPEPWIPAPEPPSLRCLVVRVRGAVPLEVECATPEDAAAFVRLVSVGGVS